jgi:hypothetical protein
MTTPARATTGGRAYLDLRKKARRDRRPVDELMHFYVLECFLDRLTTTRFTDTFVLKGGVLLAAFGERRPTRDVDLLAQATDNDPAVILAAITEIAGISVDDGVIFDTSTAATEVIRDEDLYPGVRVSMAARLSTARPGFHVDVSVGDPVFPPPVTTRIPRLLGGDIALRGYPLAMVHAEKIVTAQQGHYQHPVARLRRHVPADPAPAHRRIRTPRIHPPGRPAPVHQPRASQPGARRLRRAGPAALERLAAQTATR